MPACEGHRRPGLLCSDEDDARIVAKHAARELRVGVNLPWSFAYCGYDFGQPPTGWRSKHPSPRDWEKDLGATLRRAHASGVRVLRFFVLADGVCYPERGSLEDFVVLHGAKDAPKHASMVETLRADAPALPTLSDAFVGDLEGLLDLCDDIGLGAIPSFVSFEAFFPPVFVADGTVKQGRGALALGEGRNADEAHLDRFLAATLDRLLAIPGPRGEERHPAVLAWEVANEPDWAVQKGYVSADAMCRFLGRSVEHVSRAGFVASIGFVWANVDWMTPALKRHLLELASEKRYLHQLHYYPRVGDSLPDVWDSPFGDATIIGEMASNDSERARWPDLSSKTSEKRPEHYLIQRLVRAESQGYSLAILWSIFANDDKSGFDASIVRQLAAFTGEG